MLQGYRPFRSRRWPVVLITLGILLLSATFVLAYEGGIEWSDPFRITDADSLVRHSAIAADNYGHVHVFWAYDPDSDEPTNMLFYRQKSENGWSEPIDIFLGADWDAFSKPVVAIHDARLHLLWIGLQGLYYSSALVTEAGSAKGWQPPVTVVQTDALWQAALAVDVQGSVHVISSRLRPGTNVLYTRSDDGGLTWSETVPVSTILPQDEQAPDYIDLTIDDQGLLHVAWCENYPPNFLGRQVLYAQSRDRGLTWTPPMPLSERSQEAAQNSAPNIVVDSGGHLHVMWACGDPLGRCFRSSDNGGITWTATARPFAPLFGLAGRDALAGDTYGNLYWAGTVRFPLAFYASIFDGRAWQEPPQTVLTEDRFGRIGRGHYPQIALSLGNQLHILLVESDNGPLWYLHGQTSQPRMAPLVPPAPPTTVSPSPASTVVTPPNQPTHPLPAASFDIVQPPDYSGVLPVLVGFLAAGILVIGTIVFTRKRRP